ncbi:hypothetical protein SAMN05192529_10290 [Arachidicoccus rhizosphaerae]|uniref:Uncharacterized protein n=2 Tax=Arachidicoccus rhizosphaerae TaxID=551991 RepID=A0A1H3W2W7_9BACT|nr:hypothetical protein SAMN05192529_10290 [Arachidicoccus rhizosphaerae]
MFKAKITGLGDLEKAIEKAKSEMKNSAKEKAIGIYDKILDKYPGVKEKYNVRYEFSPNGELPGKLVSDPMPDDLKKQIEEDINNYKE